MVWDLLNCLLVNYTAATAWCSMNPFSVDACNHSWLHWNVLNCIMQCPSPLAHFDRFQWFCCRMQTRVSAVHRGNKSTLKSPTYRPSCNFDRSQWFCRRKNERCMSTGDGSGLDVSMNWVRRPWRAEEGRAECRLLKQLLQRPLSN